MTQPKYNYSIIIMSKTQRALPYRRVVDASVAKPKIQLLNMNPGMIMREDDKRMMNAKI
jgi:hypothetical protein